MQKEKKELLNLTIQALDDADQGLVEFKKAFITASDALEDGSDKQAYQAISQITPRLQEFAEFSATVLDNSRNWLDDDEIKELYDLNQQLQNTVTAIINSAENKDLFDVADGLRVDMVNIMNGYSEAFTDVRKKLEPYQQEAQQ